MGADILSKKGLRPRECRFHLDERFGWTEVGLFASKKSTHCLLCYTITLPAPLGAEIYGTDMARAMSLCSWELYLEFIMTEFILLFAPFWPA